MPSVGGIGNIVGKKGVIVYETYRKNCENAGSCNDHHTVDQCFVLCDSRNEVGTKLNKKKNEPQVTNPRESKKTVKL